MFKHNQPLKQLSCPSLSERYRASQKYIDALNRLPPTYEIGQVTKFSQIVPDPIRISEIESRLNQVNKAHENWNEIRQRTQECAIAVTSVNSLNLTTTTTTNTLPNPNPNSNSTTNPTPHDPNTKN